MHGGSWPGMPGWVHAINYFPNLCMGLLQLLTHHRNWRKHFNPSGTNCYPPFVLTGTSLRSIECPPFSFRDWPFQIHTKMHSERKSFYYSHTDWDTGSMSGWMLHQAYHVFQIEVRLSGYIFLQSFVSFSRLTPHGFFQNLWELLHRYGVVFCLHSNFDILLLWEHDCTLMDAALVTKIFDRQEQETLNWYQHYKGVHRIGNMLCSDGFTIDSIILTKEVGQSSRDFPLQFPIGPDHKLWLKMIYSLTQAGHRLMGHLGRYIGVPHRPDVWFVSKTLSFLFLKVDLGGHDVYTLNQTLRMTRYGTTYTYSHHNMSPCSEAR